MLLPAHRVLAALILTLLLAGAAPAAQVEGLYEGEVPVASEDEAERDRALGEALRQVIAKLTGVAEPGGAVVGAAVAGPQRFLQQLRYRERADAGAPLTLWARFDSAAVDALVRDAGLPQWSAQRPGLLAWLAIERAGTPEIVAPEAGVEDGGLGESLVRGAWRNGVPLSFPLLDLEDRVRVQPATVWQQDMTAIGEASERYVPGALLIGRVESNGAGAWIGRWRFQERDDVDEWETRGLTPADTGNGVFERIARRLASRYAVVAADVGGGTVQATVSGVRTLGDYARTLEYLQGLDQISNLAFAGARGEEFSFHMQVRGGAGTLRRLTSFGGVLAAEPASADDAGVRFRLLP